MDQFTLFLSPLYIITAFYVLIPKENVEIEPRLFVRLLYQYQRDT